MPAADFLDTNVVIYAYGTDASNKSRALDLLASGSTISTQVLNETVSVFRRKKMMADAMIGTAIDDLAAWCQVVQVDIATIKLALDLAERYQFSYYDALMVAAAVAANCTPLYSEDLHHGLVVSGSLSIRNPFIDAAPH
jgi:predicted nucleic acid-binding protein